MLEVKVAEIARTELRRLNVRFNAFAKGSPWSGGGVNGGAKFPDLIVTPGNFRVPVFDGIAPAGPAVDEFAPNDLVIENQGLFASYLSSDFLFNLAIDAAKEKGLAKILAEPTLTTLTGQEAKFLSGGEFPIPVPQGLDGITVEFKEFGVGLSFLPVVFEHRPYQSQGQRERQPAVDCPSVIVKSQTASSSFFVPCLEKRDASGTIELGDGQTMGLAGLLNDNLRETVTKFPGLGSVPVIGALFRSQQYLKGETELVILVTPRLAKPLPAGNIRCRPTASSSRAIRSSTCSASLRARATVGRARILPADNKPTEPAKGEFHDIQNHCDNSGVHCPRCLLVVEPGRRRVRRIGAPDD